MRELKSLQWINERFQNCRCEPSYLKNYKKTAPKVAKLIRKAGLTIVGKAYHQFDRGYTCVWLLKQSHLSLHSWPEYGFLTINIEVCSFKGDNPTKIEKLHSSLIELFQPKSHHDRKSLVLLK